LEFYGFYIISFILYFVAGTSRCIRNGDYQSIPHSISVGMVSACLAIAVTSIVWGRPEQVSHGYAVGTGVLIALAGRELTDKTIVFALKRMGVLNDDGKPKDSAKKRNR